MTALPTTILSPEQADVFPVDTFRALVENRLLDVHGQLEKLPADPRGPKLPSKMELNAQLGLNARNDSMMGGLLEHFATAAIAATTGIVIPAGISMAAQALQSDAPKSSTVAATASSSLSSGFRRKAGFSRQTPVVTAKPAASAPTARFRTIRMAQGQNLSPKAKQAAAEKRARLMREFYDLMEKHMLLDTYSKQGITHVKMTKDGKELNPLAGAPRFVMREQRETYERKAAAPQPAWQAPRFGLAA